MSNGDSSGSDASPEQARPEKSPRVILAYGLIAAFGVLGPMAMFIPILVEHSFRAYSWVFFKLIFGGLEFPLVGLPLIVAIVLGLACRQNLAAVVIGCLALAAWFFVGCSVAGSGV